MPVAPARPEEVCLFVAGVAVMPQGSIKKIVSDRGFGFINTGRGDVFFHLSALSDGVFEDLQEGQMVEFETEDGPKGPRAVSVRVVGS
jgi:CspA family cold shock protein